MMFMKDEVRMQDSPAAKEGDLGTPVVELRNVSCAYEGGHHALTGVSFSARDGEIICLLGPSGCGKTTTLRVIAGFEAISQGEVYLNGRLVSAHTAMAAS